MEKKILRERRRRFAAFLMALVMIFPALGVAETGTSTTQADSETITWNFTYIDTPSAWVTIYKTGATVENIQYTLENSTATCTAGGKATVKLSGTYYTGSEGFAGESVSCTIQEVSVPAAGHKLDHVEAKSATCTNDGNYEYWKCSVCGACFGKGTGEEPDKESHWIIPKDPTAHPDGKLTKTEAKAATCKEAGNSEYWTCSECGNYFSDAQGQNKIAENSWVIAIKPEAHPDGKLTKTEAKAATCKEAGNSEYWTCSECGNYFSDAQGKNKIAENSWVKAIDPEAHPDGKLSKTDAKAATCKEAGNSEYWTCSECGNYFSDAQGKNKIAANSWVKAIDPEAHPDGKLSKTDAKAATCKETGNSEYWTCSECGKYFSDANGTTEIVKDSWIIAKDPEAHPKDKLTKIDASAATCTEKGNNAYWACSECGKYFSDEGKTEIEKDSWDISATGHEWKAVKWTWAEDYSSATVDLVCQNNEDHKKTITVTPDAEPVKAETCGENRIVTYTATVKYDGKTFTDKKENIEVAGTATGKHQLTAVEAKEPTCTEAGNKAYWYCPECGKYFSDAEGKTEIEKDSWILPATGKHQLTAVEAKEPTCTEAGNEAYWYCPDCGKYFSDADGKTEIKKDSWILPATTDEHAWTFTEITWTESEAGGYAATAHFKCTNSETHTTEAKMTVSSETTDATCKVAGKTVYTASLAADDSPDKTEHTDEKTVTIEKKAHTPTKTKENETAPTCETGGSYDEVVYCSSCKAQLSRTTVTTEKLGHDWGDWTVTQAATEEQEGLKEHTCNRCEKKETESIPKVKPSGSEGESTGGDSTGDEGGAGGESTGGDGTGTEGEGTGTEDDGDGTEGDGTDGTGTQDDGDGTEDDGTDGTGTEGEGDGTDDDNTGTDGDGTDDDNTGTEGEGTGTDDNNNESDTSEETQVKSGTVIIHQGGLSYLTKVIKTGKTIKVNASNADVIKKGAIKDKYKKVTLVLSSKTKVGPQIINSKKAKKTKTVVIKAANGQKLTASQFDQKAFKGFKGKIIIDKKSMSKKEFKKLKKKLRQGGFKGKIQYK